MPTHIHYCFFAVRTSRKDQNTYTYAMGADSFFFLSVLQELRPRPEKSPARPATNDESILPYTTRRALGEGSSFLGARR